MNLLFFSWYMTVLARDYFLVYQIKDIRNGKTSSRLWKVGFSISFTETSKRSTKIWRYL